MEHYSREEFQIFSDIMRGYYEIKNYCEAFLKRSDDPFDSWLKSMKKTEAGQGIVDMFTRPLSDMPLYINDINLFDGKKSYESYIARFRLRVGH